MTILYWKCEYPDMGGRKPLRTAETTTTELPWETQTAQPFATPPFPAYELSSVPLPIVSEKSS